MRAFVTYLRTSDQLEFGAGLYTEILGQNFQECSETSLIGNSNFIESHLGVRQRSREGVVRRNGRPKGCFGESVSSLPT